MSGSRILAAMVTIGAVVPWAATSIHAQTTTGLITGQVVSVRDGTPLVNAVVRYTQLQTFTRGVRGVQEGGRFALPLLPPGNYRLRVEAPEFQAQEVHNLQLAVAGTLDLIFRLRPLKDVWEQRERHNVFLSDKSVLVFFGPDVDLSRTTTVQAPAGRNGILESTFSQVVNPVLIRELPLAGRDVYAVLATEAAVTSDAATSRGLGLSVNGQRPTSSNYLLDGLENNNYLLAGPFTVVAPEAVQEYRVSTNNFSAEYGRTSGFVANAVAKSGSTNWHGQAYTYFKNEALNANDFQHNAMRQSRSPLKQVEPGFFIGGPLQRDKLFISAALETLRFRSAGDQEEIVLPSVQFLSQLQPDGVAANLFRKYPPPLAAGVGPCVLGGGTDGETGCSASVRVAPPSSLDQTLALSRADRLFKQGSDRLMARLAVTRVNRPDFSWSPYPDFTSPLIQNTTGLALAWTDASRPGMTVEARGGISIDELRFDRANSQVPGLSGPSGMLLPGSPLFYSYRNRSRNIEGVGGLTKTTGRHVLKFGGGLLARGISGYQTTGRDGYFSFFSATQIAEDQPSSFSIAVLRSGSSSIIPDYDRQYRYIQFAGFFQDSWRLTNRLNFNYGVRYENFGTPVNTGPVKDTVVALGPGDTLPASLQSSPGFVTPGSGDQNLYDRDNRNWAGRFGFAYSIDASGKNVIRGAYGLFYDRPFDNLWQTLRNNNVQLATADLTGPSNFSVWGRAISGALDSVTRNEIFQGVTLFQPGLRTAYAQNYFLSLRRVMSQNLTIELAALGSLGRELIATDAVNRRIGRANNAFPDISYRSNQGNSNYSAGSAIVSYRAKRQYWQVSYTLSHAIDNQSDPLAGEYGDLEFASSLAGQASYQATFSRQYDSRADRGSSNFDQRHNLVVLGVVELPGPAQSSRFARVLNDWRISWLAAIRSGFPYTVGALAPLDLLHPRLINNRANILDPQGVYAGDIPTTGGKVLLNAAAFGQPGVGVLGNSGRNAFEGPGFWNVDFSLSRTFSLPWLGEGGRLSIRADAFNLLNHANLGNPNATLFDENFGVALYGRQGYNPGFPAVVPFRETARQVQLMVRVEF